MTGSIALACAVRHGRSSVVRVRYDGLLRVSRPRHAGTGVAVVLAHLGPGLLAGDRYALDVRVEAAADLTVTGQMATPVYAGVDGRGRAAPAVMRAAWQVAAGATLVVRGEPVLLDGGAAYDLMQTVDVAAGGLAILTEIVAVGPGAAARLRTLVRRDGVLAARDACDLGATSAAVATVLVAGDDRRRAACAPAMQRVLEEAGAVRGGIGATPGALLVRATAERVWTLRELTRDLVAAACGAPRDAGVVARSAQAP